MTALDFMLTQGPRLVNLAVLLLGLYCLWKVRHRHPIAFGHFAAVSPLLLWLTGFALFWAIEYLVLLIHPDGSLHGPARPQYLQLAVLLLEVATLACIMFGVASYWRRLRGCVYDRWSAFIFPCGLCAGLLAVGIVLIARPEEHRQAASGVGMCWASLPEALMSASAMFGLGMFFVESYSRLRQRLVARFLLWTMLVYGAVQLVQVLEVGLQRQERLNSALFVACIFLKGPLLGGMVGLGLVGRSTAKLRKSLGQAAIVVDERDRVIFSAFEGTAHPIPEIQVGEPLETALHQEDRRSYGRWSTNVPGAKQGHVAHQCRLRNGERVRVERMQFDDVGDADGHASAVVHLLADDESYVVFQGQDLAALHEAVTLWSALQHVLRGNLDQVSTLVKEAVRNGNQARLDELPRVCSHLNDEVMEQLSLIQHIYSDAGYAKLVVKEEMIDIAAILRSEVDRWKMVMGWDAKHYNVSLRSDSRIMDPESLIEFTSSLDTFYCEISVVILKTTIREMLLNALKHRAHGPVSVKLTRAQDGRPVVHVRNSLRGRSEEDVMKAVAARNGGIQLVRRALEHTRTQLNYQFNDSQAPEESTLTATYKIGLVVT